MAINPWTSTPTRIKKRHGARLESLEERSLLSTLLASSDGEDSSESEGPDVVLVAPHRSQVSSMSQEASDGTDATPISQHSPTPGSTSSSSPVAGTGDDSSDTTSTETGTSAVPSQPGMPQPSGTNNASDGTASEDNTPASSSPVRASAGVPSSTSSSDPRETEDNGAAAPTSSQKAPAPLTPTGSSLTASAGSSNTGGLTPISAGDQLKGSVQGVSTTNSSDGASSGPASLDELGSSGASSLASPRADATAFAVGDDAFTASLVSSTWSRGIVGSGTRAAALTVAQGNAPLPQEMSACIPSSDEVGAPSLAAAESAPLAARAADLLASFSPFDRETIEGAIDHFLDRLGALEEGLANLDLTTSLVPNITAAAVVISVAEVIRRRRRADDKDGRDAEDECPRRLPGLPLGWAMEEA